MTTKTLTTKTLTTKAEFLNRIRAALAGSDAGALKDEGSLSSLPPVPDVWPLRGLSREELRSRFAESLTAVAGECVACSDLRDAADKTTALLREAGAVRVALPDHPFTRRVVPLLQGITLIGPPDEPGVGDQGTVNLGELARCDAAILSPEYLLADSGSALLAAPTVFDRLAIYMPPICLLLAPGSLLREHLPHVWQEFRTQWDRSPAGEFVVVTGPSRTADIEKKLVLGVHGPKKLVVFLIDTVL